MNKEDKYLNEEKKYKIQIKNIKDKWIDETPKGKYSKKDAEMIINKAIKNGRNPKSIKIVKEVEELDILDRIEIEQLIKETKEYLDDDELCEMAIQAAGWGKSSIEKFGKTIGASPTEHGFIDKCVMRMKGKKGWDKEKAGGFCASIVDKAKGSTDWRKGNHK
jgi:hypothetical protein